MQEKTQYDENKVIIVGDGTVGSTYAHSLVTRDVADIIGIIDVNKGKAEGDAMDLMHALPYMNVPVKTVFSAGFEDCHDADIVAITANAPNAKFDAEFSRLTLLKNNVSMIKEIVEKVVESGFNGIFLVASNPVDVLSQVVMEVSGFPREKVIGTGTLIDTARLKRIIADQIQVDPRNIHGYILGEHGESSFAAWSNITIGSKAISRWVAKNPEYEMPSFDEIDERVRNIGFDIFHKKGATYYGIASALVRITTSILRNENSILPVSTYLQGEYGHEGVFIGVPAVINKQGVRETLNLYLNEDELLKLAKSVTLLKENFESISSEIKKEDK
ncbi:MAG: L-lactate dehydrogenase [Streptococcaceae bacterium]|jgi:L-lactate dehydrogenase|nr:L-lactate dehydrogenase [Streptococcaceae bacterium]